MGNSVKLNSHALSPASMESSHHHRRNSVHTVLPSYNQLFPDDLPDLIKRLADLDITHLENHKTETTTINHCIAHLKLLEAFHQLRTDIGSTTGIFGILDPPVGSEIAVETTVYGDRKNGDEVLPNPIVLNLAQLRVREKRWAIYVSRAVDRFESWWSKCVPMTYGGKKTGELSTSVIEARSGLGNIPLGAQPIPDLTSAENLPPLDVIMVWHSYMLNPRCFLEDCYRLGKMDFFATPFPLAAIDSCIDNTTFEFNPLSVAVTNFESSTDRPWDNFKDGNNKTIVCHLCESTFEVPWTWGSQWNPEETNMDPGIGYADGLFLDQCPKCTVNVTHDSLRARKFAMDVRRLRYRKIPLPGTVLSYQGQPDDFWSWKSKKYPTFFYPNVLIQSSDRLASILSNCNSGSLHMVKSILENQVGYRLSKKSKKILGFTFRRMLSRYWDNSSPFALDLVGAVLRQGVFVEKMHDIDWLHSPALNFTMGRLLKRYERFFDIMATEETHMAVPTLDVDLAWHTHQLHAQAYYVYSDAKTKHRFIDHNDKVSDVQLNDAFTWTSKIYQERYGEVYSECKCWYCEAVRESDPPRLGGLFKAKRQDVLERTREVKGEPKDSKHYGPHISAHNAVQTSESEIKLRTEAYKLSRAHQRACNRARKKGDLEPDRREFIWYYYGCPVTYPVYYPFVPSFDISGGPALYHADPTSVETIPGAYGVCVTGTCSGMTASGGDPSGNLDILSNEFVCGGCSSAIEGCPEYAGEVDEGYAALCQGMRTNGTMVGAPRHSIQDNGGDCGSGGCGGGCGGGGGGCGGSG